MQEVLEQPSAENRHRAFWETPLRPPDVVGLAEAIHAAPSLEASAAAAAAAKPKDDDILAHAFFDGNLARVAQLVQNHALQALEVLGHHPQSHRRERGCVAKPSDGLKRGDHGLDLLVVLPVPLANLQG